ncbi:glycosyltransferase family 2 protein [Ascidiaceihabitans sp.]|nr:glycosyltransferase family 2 protein [Ascidiaceihabitans sp.]
MQDNPLVSVILPTHGGNVYLKSAIESVVGQSYSNIELIIIDDASTSQQMIYELIESISGIEVKYIRFDESVGGAKARNVGIDKAEGNFIALLDSDDLWHPEKLFYQLKFRNIANVIGCSNEVFSNTSHLTDLNEKLTHLPQLVIVDDIVGELFGKTGHSLTFQTSTLLIASDIAKSVKFNESLVRHQDYQYILDLNLICGKFAYLSEYLCYYRKAKSPFSKLTKWKFFYSADFLKLYYSYFSSVQLKNFFVSQLFVPSIKTGELFLWIKFAKKYGIFEISLIWKIFKFIIWRLVNK